MVFIEKNEIQAISYYSENYPKHLLACVDSPSLIYYKGTDVLQHPRVIAMVGTRKPSNYGKECCEKLVEALSEFNVLIISGLAYGIDICAHRAALKNGLPTIGVTAHGFERLYPSTHKKTTEQMLLNGGLLTDFVSTSDFLPQNFIRRNRIIAGLADATIVIESGKSGGSMITADLANSYNRDVFAVPGRIDSKLSEGCNWLIKTNRAALLDSVAEMAEVLGWTTTNNKPRPQRELFVNLSPEESRIVDVLKNDGPLTFDLLAAQAQLSQSIVASSLLNLEFSGLVKPLPGRCYVLV